MYGHPHRRSRRGDSHPRRLLRRRAAYSKCEVNRSAGLEDAEAPSLDEILAPPSMLPIRSELESAELDRALQSLPKAPALS